MASDRPVISLTEAPSLLSSYRRAVIRRGRPMADGPRQVLRLTGVRPDVAQVARYAAVCGDRLSSVLPPLYPHLLGFGLQLALLTDPASPFAPIGLVHVANSVTIEQPVPIDAALDIEVQLEPPVPHRRGRTVDLLARVSVGDQVIWTSVSTYLHPERRPSPDGPASSTGSGDAGDPPAAASAVWRLPGDLGRQYAAVSGDRNPIHMSAASARIFGFRRAIAHGMWTAARCLGALEGRLPERFSNEVTFRAPILLPRTVEFVELSLSDAAGRLGYEVRSRGSGRVHLSGSVIPS